MTVDLALHVPPYLLVGGILTDPPEPSLSVALLALVFGLGSVAAAVASWRGWEPRKVRAWIDENGLPVPSPAGAFTQYQSMQGSGYLAILMAPGFLSIGLVTLGGVLLDTEYPAIGWTVIELSWFVAAPIYAVAMLAYFWTGLPDRLRPPAQRGWEIIDGEYRRVREGPRRAHDLHSAT